MGPLTGFTVIELAGIGPGPMAGMMLADWGAEVIRVDRSYQQPTPPRKDVSARGKKSIVLDLKSPTGKEALLRLVEKADALIEGYRPGVTEKLGIGPDQCHARNPKLVYGRMTGWGQTGPLSHTAGHDINYIALTGALHAVGRPGEKPAVPLNLFGDMGGGGMLLVSGLLAAMLEAQKSGKGQVVDAAMVDGAAQLMWMFHGFHESGRWDAEDRGVNLLDGGAHFYDTYETSDGKFIALGAIEPQFYDELLKRAGLDQTYFTAKSQLDKSRWDEFRSTLTGIFLTKTRDEWCELLEETDACFAPVLTFLEAPEHPHNKERRTYQKVDGYMQPSPAPRFSRTVSRIQHGQHAPGSDTRDVLERYGFSLEEINAISS